MPTVGDAVATLGYEHTDEALVVLARPERGEEKTLWVHAPLDEITQRSLSEFGDLYVATGRFGAGSISRYAGRRSENLVDIYDLPFDFDLAPYLGLEKDRIWTFSQRDLDELAAALTDHALEVMRACNIPITTIIGTGYGVLVLSRVRLSDRAHVSALQDLHANLVESINTSAGMALCDAQVKDAGTRIVRVPGSVNTKGPEPRTVTILASPGELLSLDGFPALRRERIVHHIPEPMALPEGMADRLVDAFSAIWQEGSRHGAALGLAAMMVKSGVSRADAEELIRRSAYGDSEIHDRVRAVHTTYDHAEAGNSIAGFTRLRDFVPGAALDTVDAELRRLYRAGAGRERIVHWDAGPVPAQEQSGEVAPLVPDRPLRQPPRPYGWFADYHVLMAPTTSAAPIFHLASALTVAGIMIGRRVGTFFADDHWPILHTVLVGESGRSKKDTAMNRATRLLTDPDGERWHMEFTHLRGVGTAEGIAESLHVKPMLLHVSEFAELLHKGRQQATANLVPSLLSLWNCPPSQDLLRVSNPIRVENPTLALLAGIPPQTLEQLMTMGDVQSGLANRLLLVYGEGLEEIDDPPRPDPLQSRLLARELRQAIRGYTPGTMLEKGRRARDWWADWHAQFSRERYFNEVERTLAERVPAQIHRVATIYAVSDGSDVLDADHLEAAADFVMAVFAGARPHVVRWGRGDEARLYGEIVDLLRQPCKRREVDLALSGRYGPSMVRRALEAMRENGRIYIDARDVVTDLAEAA